MNQQVYLDHNASSALDLFSCWMCSTKGLLCVFNEAFCYVTHGHSRSCKQQQVSIAMQQAIPSLKVQRMPHVLGEANPSLLLLRSLEKS